MRKYDRRLENFIEITSQKQEREEMFKIILEEEIEGRVEGIISPSEKEKPFIKGRKDYKNGFYRDTLVTTLTVEALSMSKPEARGFIPLSLDPRRGTLYTPDEVVIAMHERWIFHQGHNQNLEDAPGRKTLSGWISRTTSMVMEKVEECWERPIKLWCPTFFLDGVVLRIHLHEEHQGSGFTFYL